MKQNYDSNKPYERLYKRPLSDREIFDMRNNLRQFFEILIEIDREQNNDKNKRSSDNTNQTK
jgi:hypothetical protein